MEIKAARGKINVNKQKMEKFFPCYLILGERTIRRRNTEALAQSLDIDLKIPSPDIFLIAPQKNSSNSKQASISIDQIRQLKSHIFQKPVHHSYKFVILEDAQELTLEAQNALLKILEEPPTQVIVVLEARDKSQLLPTIRSRVVSRIFYNLKRPRESFSLMGEGKTLNQLEKLSQITNPQDWLDDQILLLHQSLKSKLGDNNAKEILEISQMIEKCIQAKKMIEANVNPKFVLFNLVFNLQPQN
ncbi:hypothetical protein HYS90_01010 [Candidatus Curtissbacteria bacterium]|nr:hypothetical protein [Candidatus Curtissbacteria bacterium]